MDSARWEESRISTPMAEEICGGLLVGWEMGEGGIWGMGGRRGERRGRGWGGGTNVFEHFDSGGHVFYLCVILVLEFGEDGVGVLSSVWLSSLAYPFGVT